tara:strand:- start:155 stop:520 length:366 start_codon:yes stop_codon:yes gene_type:complete
MVSYPLNKDNSLKRTSDIDAVFKNGKKVSSNLISLYYIKSNHPKIRTAFSVGKKSHKLASTRNKLKRLMKEAFRLNAKDFIEQQLYCDFVFVYFGTDKVNFNDVEQSMKSLLLSLQTKNLS